MPAQIGDIGPDADGGSSRHAALDDLNISAVGELQLASVVRSAVRCNPDFGGGLDFFPVTRIDAPLDRHSDKLLEAQARPEQVGQLGKKAGVGAVPNGKAIVGIE